MSLLQADPGAPEASQPATSSRAPRRDWRWTSLAIGGVVFAAGNLLHPLEHTDAAYQAATWTAAHLTIFASLPLLVLGLPALSSHLASRVARPLATLPVVASIIGLIGIGPGCVLEAFVAPVIGHEAMVDLESGGMGVVNAILGSAYLGGTIALGWAARRARLRPGWAGPSLIASSVVLLAVMGATGPAVGVVIIGGTTVYGLSLAALALCAARER